MLAKDDETDGQGRGQEEPDGAPEPGPEGDGHEKGRLGETQRLAVENGLDHHVGKRLDDEEETDREEGTRPAGKDREAHGDGRQRGHQGSDIGHEAKGEGARARLAVARLYLADDRPVLGELQEDDARGFPLHANRVDDLSQRLPATAIQITADRSRGARSDSLDV